MHIEIELTETQHQFLREVLDSKQDIGIALTILLRTNMQGEAIYATRFNLDNITPNKPKVQIFYTYDNPFKKPLPDADIKPTKRVAPQILSYSNHMWGTERYPVTFDKEVMLMDKFIILDKKGNRIPVVVTSRSLAHPTQAYIRPVSFKHDTPEIMDNLTKEVVEFSRGFSEGEEKLIQ